MKMVKNTGEGGGEIKMFYNTFLVLLKNIVSNNDMLCNNFNSNKEMHTLICEFIVAIYEASDI